MWYYLSVFAAAFLVDLLPFFGPPAWTVMVFFQMKFNLNIWFVLVSGVLGSALGRYTLFLYIPYLSDRYIKVDKNQDLHFIGTKLAEKGWKIQAFVLLYTLMPLPTTTLFSAAGIAKIKAIYIVPTFLVGKFLSDLVMVFTGDYVANNTASFLKGFLNWKSLSGIVLGIFILCMLLFIDWRKLLIEKKFSLNFKILK
jgi:membrane protein YqaA with SNARE-associated domain